MQAAVRFWVTGRVQGVYFRAHTKAKAEELGLSGWVQNLADGRVEGVASGECAALHALTEWLASGPEQARVTNLEVQAEPYANWQGFDVI